MLKCGMLLNHITCRVNDTTLNHSAINYTNAICIYKYVNKPSIQINK